MSRLLTIREVADYLGVSVQTIYNWRYRGEGPPGLKVMGQVRYRPEDLEGWLSDQADDRQPA